MYDDDDDDGAARLRAAASVAVRTGRAAVMVKGAIIIAVIGVVMLLIMIVVVASGMQSQNDASDYQCITPGDSGDAPPAPSGTVEQQQIGNAKVIGKVVSDLGLPGGATLIALTAAAGETDLTTKNGQHGDAAGPDSLGLFQQRSAWGTEKQRLNPTYATQSFLLGPRHDGKDHGPGGTGLVAVNGWQMLSVSAAIHAVQRNADPNHYTSYQARAEQIAKKAGIDLDAPGSSPSATASSDEDDEAAAAAASDSGGECGTTGDGAIGPIGTGPCPLDSKAAPGKKNPSSCNQALTFVKKQMDSGSTAWGRQCLHLVMTAYGWHGGPATAFQAAQIVEAKHMMSKDTKHIPKGAVMWWDGRATGNTAGHVAIYDGNGHIFSNDVKGVGTVGVVPWTFPAKSWGQKWMGWSPPYFPTGV